MTRLSVGETLDEMIGFVYEHQQKFLRPRLASYTFGELMRTPVHDLPHDGAGVLAFPERTWNAVARSCGIRQDFPSAVEMRTLIGIAVEQW